MEGHPNVSKNARTTCTLLVWVKKLVFCGTLRRANAFIVQYPLQPNLEQQETTMHIVAYPQIDWKNLREFC
jgi:hypothetical protein